MFNDVIYNICTDHWCTTKMQCRREVCDTVIWAYLLCDSETSLKLRSYIWRLLKYFCSFFACWFSGESTHSAGGIWRFGVLHLRRFDSVTSVLHDKALNARVWWSLREQWGEKRHAFLITKLQDSQGFIAAMDREVQERATSVAACAKVLSNSWSSACCS